ncbi:hypothetical protein PHLGIDRAFT_33082 [Phlebiopsis gigantea 11061_1 CR5-6]|uniref:PHD-type domain-containing protein n=1 Tax=Phlebiopsis gigantea (strain 11061_1 CR5-6) TaxID=745531 RepID=A0A0C3P298_PHLG1|nr:hypothetical protein PHLGIDRAFT_33082 [Phlebiopsis gigantea 11061_1 CR5-6]
MASLGMEGLEALVQAATQRLNEEMTEDTEQANSSRRDPLLHAQQSPLMTTVERSVPSSPLVGRDAPFNARPSPQGASDTPPQHEQRLVPIQSHIQAFSSPTHVLVPVRENAVATSSSLLVPASASRQSSRTTHPSDLMMDDTEALPPPPKRRRSSERSVRTALPDPALPTATPYSPLTDVTSQAKVEPIPLIGPGVAPPLDKSHISTRIVGLTPKTVVELESNSTRESGSPTPVPVPSRLTSVSANPPLVPASPDVDNVNVRATSSPMTLLSVASNDAPAPEAHSKPKTKRKRAEGKEASRSKGKERLAERRMQHNSTARDDDTDDWFREQFGEPVATKSPDASSAVLAATEPSTRPDPSVIHPKKPSRLSPPSHRTTASSRKLPQEWRGRSPTPLAMLEAELEGVITISARPLSPAPPLVKSQSMSPSPRRKPESLPPIDVDLDTELERAVAGEVEPDVPPTPKQKPRPRPRPRPKVKAEDPVQLDVEDELLALLDGGDGGEKARKHRTHHAHTQPPTSAKDDISTPMTSSDGAGPSEHRGRKKHALRVTKAIAPGSAVSSPALDGVSTMPPPTSRDVSQARDNSTARIAKDEYEPLTAAPTPTAGTPSTTPAPTPVPVATSNNKESSMTAPKRKAPAKPKVKATSIARPKPRPSLAKERSATPVSSPHATPNPNEPSTSTSKSKKSSNHLAAKRAVSAATGGASRSRSTSVMPGESEANARKRSGQTQEEKGKEDDKEDEEKEVDDRLYCVCRTSYDEDRVMIACDRCDEWYHTQCVNMPDLEVDLVDQFICPLCVSNNPHLPLRTTYKKRCLAGLGHPRPASQHACHKPARGAFSKYCSDECGVGYMRERIEKYAKNVTKTVAKNSREAKEQGEFRGLWAAVKDAGRREGVVVRMLHENFDSPRTEIVMPRVPKTTRLRERLEFQINKISRRRAELKAEQGIVIWRATILDHAAHRADRVGHCGWDGRLLWSDEEVLTFGTEVIDSYDRTAMRYPGDEMAVDRADESGNDDREWWCTGKKKCDRHAGWQKLRLAEVDLERELFEAELEKLTTRERDLRRRIEDLCAAQPESDLLLNSPGVSHAARTGRLQLGNGTMSAASTPSVDDVAVTIIGVNGINGVDDAKKGKKRKLEGR